MHRLRSRSARTLLLGLAAALTVTVSGVGASAAHGASPARLPVDDGLPAGHTYKVTLLTGDVVTVHTRPAGCPTVTVDPASPSGTYTKTCGPDLHVRVVPGAVRGLVGRVVDDKLFDVTTLIAQGYDDARSTDLPLIVQSTGPTTHAAASPLTSGLRQQRALASIDAVAGRQPKANAGASRVAKALTTAKSTATSGIKIWLDQRVRATGLSTLATGTNNGLDSNLRQVGAPQAWQAGHTGQGVRVAVLDTGVDATHPDLAGKVAEKADFTTENGDAGDRFGHGTHVAATIAGSGVASDGERRGVAPDAHLVIGKVLDDQGSGTDSQVIAGMQWAAQRAPVINMSLGGWDASDGSDPLSQAVDALTKQTGALFVIAAGNSGPGEASISSPGAAATALTVGAVNADDKLADFSSRGPLVTTRAAKPEIVAPGVEIVEARAASTSMGRPIDGRYTAASGTSMATPHVAGAAAILAQTHPGWHAAQIKAALVGAAHPLPSAQAYDAGAGRLDIPHALVGTVSNQAVVNLGTFSYPQDGTAETKLAWTNSATTAATLTLGITLADRHGVAGPKNAAKLSNTSLVVPAGATGSTSLLIDRSKFGSRPGLYAAVVTARAGSNTITTPVAFYVEPPSFDLAVSAAALPDTPADSATAGVVEVTNIDDQVLYADYVDVEPDTTTTFRVPAGRYSVMGQVYDLRPDGSARRTALAGDPDVAVNADTAVVLDGAAAKPVTATVDGVATEPTVTAVAYVQTPRRGYAWYDEVYAFGDDARNNTVYAAPASAGAGVGSFQPYEVFALDTPGDGPSPYQYDLIRTLPGTIPDNPAYRVTAADQARLARIDQRFSRLNLPGTATGHQRYGLTPDGALIGETDSRNVPATRTDYVSPGIQWSDEAFYDGVIEYGVVTEEPFHAYAAGSRQQKVWVRQPLRPDWYDDAALALSSCTPTPVSRTREMLHVQLVDLTDQHQRFDCLGDGDTWTDKTTRTLTLYADGKRVGEHDDSFGDFTIPRKAATYRLTYDLDASALLPVSTRVSTAWTFHSTGPNGTGNAAVPLLSVDYALPLDEANQPTDGMAAFTVRQTQGVTAQQITSLNLWTSTDDGVTWQSTRVQKQVGDRFTAALAQPAAGQPVSLRVSVTASGGSKFEQTIIRAC